MPRKSSIAAKGTAATSEAVAGSSRSTWDCHVLAPASSASVTPPSQGTSQGSSAATGDGRISSVEEMILDLRESEKRANALAGLSMKVGLVQDLARLIWFSIGSIAILLEEVVSVYPFLSPTSLTPQQCNRLCNVLALLKCVASHPETRVLFVKACIPYYLIVLLDKIGESWIFDGVRLSTLGVIAALVQVQDTQVVIHLLHSEVLPPCLRAMQRGSEFSRTIATYILKRLLLDGVALRYVCCKPERLFTVCQTLGSVVAVVSRCPSAQLLRHVTQCYLCLLEDQRSSFAVRQSLPQSLMDGTFDHFLREDQNTRILLRQLLDHAQIPPIAQRDNLSNLTESFHYLNTYCSSVAIDSIWLKASGIYISVTMKGDIVLILLLFVNFSS